MSIIDQMMKDAGSTAPQASIMDTMQADANSPAAPIQVNNTIQNKGLLSGSVGSQISDAASAFGHHVMNMPHGIAQLIENGINYGAQQLPNNPVSQYINKTVQSDNAAMAQREKNYQANTPNSAGAYLGATAGEVAPFVVNSVAAPLRAAGDMIGKQVANNLAGKVASGATQGALVGAAQPVTNPDYWQGKQGQIGTGTLMGGAVPLVSGAVSRVYNAGKGVIEPIINPELTAARQLASQTGQEPNAMASALRNYTQYVPGSTPTTAQVLATPEAVQLEKALGNNPEFKTQLEHLSTTNNAARLNAINSVAGNPGELETAQAARQSTAQDLYKQAFGEINPPTPWVKGQITQLMKRPAMQTAIKDAKKLALNEGTPLNNSTSIQGLHYAKMSLDDQIGNAIQKDNKNTARALTQTKEQLLTVMNKLSPTYQTAMQTYAEMSKPVNTMEAGQSLQDQLWNKPMNSVGDPNIQYQQYSTTLAKALKNSPYGINPDALDTLQNIKNDLQRQTISNGLKSPGSDTNYNQQAQGWLSRQLYGQNFSGAGASTKIAGTIAGAAAGSLVGHPMWGMGAGATAAVGLSKVAGQRVSKAMADIMTNPENAANALEKLTPAERGVMARLLSQHPLTQQLLQSGANSP